MAELMAYLTLSLKIITGICTGIAKSGMLTVQTGLGGEVLHRVHILYPYGSYET